MAKRATQGWARAWWVLFCWLAVGCAKYADSAAPVQAASAPESLAAMEAPPPAPAAPSEDEASEGREEAPARDAATAAGAPGAAAGGPAENQLATSVGDRATTKNPQLIYTATLTLAVFQTRDAMAAIERLARDSGGYLVRQNDTSITVRVPARGFRGALDAIGKVGDELHREVNARDVTDELTDLEVRLRNSEEVRRKLEALLDRAQNVEHALAVERELERVTRTIEQLKGRLKLLGELLAFSTVTVNFQARPTDHVVRETRLPFPWLGELGLPSLLSL